MRHLIILSLVLTSSAAFASNDYEIQASNVRAYPVGLILGKRARISLPEGSRIRFIDRTRTGSVVIRECGGRYSGPIEGCRPYHGVGPWVPGGTRGPDDDEE
jgi:hypothetical protein